MNTTIACPDCCGCGIHEYTDEEMNVMIRGGDCPMCNGECSVVCPMCLGAGIIANKKCTACKGEQYTRPYIND